MNKNEMILYETADHAVTLNVNTDGDTVWLNRSQLAELFDRDISVIGRHINAVFKENEVCKASNVQNLHIPNSDKPVEFYSLDVIISVGYRVKSQRGVEFRKWANNVLKEYIMNGCADLAQPFIYLRLFNALSLQASFCSFSSYYSYCRSVYQGSLR